jgi:hypothetical protein
VEDRRVLLDLTESLQYSLQFLRLEVEAAVRFLPQPQPLVVQEGALELITVLVMVQQVHLGKGIKGVVVLQQPLLLLMLVQGAAAQV